MKSKLINCIEAKEKYKFPCIKKSSQNGLVVVFMNEFHAQVLESGTSGLEPFYVIKDPKIDSQIWINIDKITLTFESGE